MATSADALTRWTSRVRPWRKATDQSRSKSTSLQGKRRRIAFFAIALGVFAAFIELPLPAEDALRAMRANLRATEVSGQIVLIEVDEQTLAEFGNEQPTRTQDGQVIEKVFEMGLERLVFDRAYADQTTARDDAAMARALANNRGRVWLGASPPADNGLQKHEGLTPTPVLKRNVNLASMMGQSTPFGLSVRFPTSTVVEGREIPSISAVLAGYNGAPNWYRPDFAFDAKTVPTVRYADILNGKVSPDALRGKTAVLAPTHLSSQDFHHLPLGGRIHGAYFHILGAETLRVGMPLDLSWHPALIIAAALLLIQAYRKRPHPRITIGSLLLLAIGPVGLELASINVDVFPALIVIAVGTWRLNHLANKVYSRSTDLMVPQAIAAKEGGELVDVYALKINNLGDFPQSQAPKDLGIFIERILSCIGAESNVRPEEGLTAFDKDTVVWTSPRANPEEVRDNALAISTLLANTSRIDLQDGKLQVSISVDVNHELSMEQRIQNALQAADLASRRGHRIRIADQGFLNDRERRVTMLSALDAALEDASINVAYQPKIDLNTGQVVGAEALVRWTHETLGVVSPQDLIAVAEEHSRINALTEYVAERAFVDARRAIAVDGRFKLAINVSAQSLSQSRLTKSLTSLCEAQGFPVGNLLLEITETQKLDDERVEANIRKLHDYGISFSIDDFGTGHSSLDYLQRFPSAELKIDRRFVMNLRTSPDSRTLVRATIDMAHSMGKTVVAEGVENDLTAMELRRMKCDLAQGFLFAGALPIDELIPLVQKRSAAA